VFFEIPKILVVALNATPSVLALITCQTKDIGFRNFSSNVFLVSENRYLHLSQINKLRFPLLIVLYFSLTFKFFDEHFGQTL